MKEVPIQTDILEQKKLNSLNSSDNCIGAAGEKSPVSYSYNSELISEKIFDRKFKRGPIK